MLFILAVCISASLLFFNTAKAGSPINVLNGNNFDASTDIVFNSPFEKGFSFKRFYNSQSTVNSTIGFGWSHSYDMSLYPDFNGSSYLIKIKGISGRGYYFADYDLDGTFSGYFQENSAVVTDASDNYIWTRDDGTIYKFDTEGRLISITDRHGNIQSLTYNADGLLETVTDQATGRALTFHYNQANKIDHITGPVTTAVPDGIWVSYTYDANSNLIGVTYADEENGSEASGFEYRYEDPNDPNNLTYKRNLSGILLSSWVYNAQDQAVENETNQGTGVTINFDDPEAVEVTDAYGVTTIYTIQEIAGRKKITMKSNSGGCNTCSEGIYQTTFDTATGYPTLREYFNGRFDAYLNYDTNFNPQTTILAQGTSSEKTITRTWHPFLASPLSITQKSLLADTNNPGRQKVTIYDYDNPEAVGNTSIPNENPTALIYRLIETGFTLNDQGVVEAYEHITTYSYNEKGQVTRIDGPRPGSDDVIIFDYHPDTGDLVTIIYPETGPVTMDYDAAGNLIHMQDINSVETVFSYDGRNRILATTINSKTTSNTYSRSGEILSTTDRSNRTTSYGYNVRGLVEKIISSNGDYLYFGYDINANMVEESIYSSQQIRTLFKGFDYGDPAANPNLAAGKPYQSIIRNQDNTQDLETEYQYLHGNLVRIIPPNGLWSGYEYDLHNRVTAKIQAISDSDTVRTEYEYDLNNNLILVRDANGLETTYLYDDANNLVQTISPDTGTFQYSYDAASNLISKNQNTTVTNYAYDNLGRLIRIEYPDDTSQNITMGYDQGQYGKGRLTSVTDAFGTCAYTYNIYGYLVSEIKTIYGITYTTSYTYDDTGNLTSITYPFGRQVIYHPDSSGRTASVSTYKTSSQTVLQNIVWHPFGPVQSMTFPNGKIYTNNVDLNYMTRNLSVSSTMDRTYLRNSTGNIDQITDNLDAARNQTFGYDPLYHLTSGTSITGNETFTYDNVGNRQTENRNGSSQAYVYSPATNHIDSIAGLSLKTFLYNPNGCITGIDARTFDYNLDNRLVKVSEGLTVLAEYAYNYKGQRVSKTVNANTTVFHYDIQGNLIAETDTAGNIIREYIYLSTTPVAMIVNSTISAFDYDQDGDIDGEDLAAVPANDVTAFAQQFGRQYSTEPGMYFYHTDHLGTPQVMTDSQGQTVWQADYTPFGTAVTTTATIENNLRFPGQYFDSETGLHYNWHRYYDPDTGRYLTPDPIGLKGGINPFVYVQNNPISRLDPSGLYDEIDFIYDALIENQNHSDYWRYEKVANQEWKEKVETTLENTAIVYTVVGIGLVSVPIVEVAYPSLLGYAMTYPEQIIIGVDIAGALTPGTPYPQTKWGQLVNFINEVFSFIRKQCE